MSDDIRLMLVDDQALVRAGFRMVLDATPGMSVVAEAADGLEAVEHVARCDVDVVLMDIRMPRLDGVEASRRIAAGVDAPKVVVLTTFDLDEYAYVALKAGAAGFLLKDAGPDELLAAVRAVHRGDAVVAPSTTRRLLERMVPDLPTSTARRDEPLQVLTEREREVLKAVGTGLSNSEIAASLFVAEATVKTHVGRILAKLGLRDRVQMVVLAYETGLVRVGS
ncbi:MAG: response regulator transcription factor [Mobilicoccus sp.]|nr:response regulator transcription factor [Mobilicoccus sp.]